MSQQISGPDDFSPQDWQELYELKEQVDETAEQTGIPRRDILKGAGLLAAGSLAGGISAQQAIERFVQEAEAQASTSDSDGNVGTPTDRVDVFAEGIDSNSVSTADLNGREYEIRSGASVSVPGDYATLQAAVDDTPRWCETKAVNTINVSDGTYGDFEVSNVNGDGDLIIDGDTTTPSNVKVGSPYVGGCQATVTIRGVEFTDDGNQPRQGGEQCAVVAEKNSWVRVTDCNFRNPNRGLLTYNATVDSSACDFDGQSQAYRVKKGGYLSAKSTDITGTCTNFANVISGFAAINSATGLTASDSLYQFEGGVADGAVFDVNSGKTISRGNLSKVKTTLSADQTLNADTDNTVAFDTLSRDRNDDYDTTNNEFVAPESGDYQIDGAVIIGPNAADQQHIVKVKNNSGNTLLLDFWYPSTGSNESYKISDTVNLSAAEKIRLTVNPATNSSTVRSGSDRTRLTISRDES